MLIFQMGKIEKAYLIVSFALPGLVYTTEFTYEHKTEINLKVIDFLIRTFSPGNCTEVSPSS